jgi:hypothetical protein
MIAEFTDQQGEGVGALLSTSARIAVSVAVFLAANEAPLAAFINRWEVIDYDVAHSVDKSEIAVWLQADKLIDNPAPTNMYNRQGLPLMAVRCVHGKPEFFINLNFEIEQGTAEVGLQFDAEPPVNAVWKTGGISAWPVDHIAFVVSMLGKKQLVMTFTFKGAAPTSTAFQIAGIDEAMGILRRHCVW